MTIVIPEWMLGVMWAMWTISIVLKFVIWRLERRMEKNRR